MTNEGNKSSGEACAICNELLGDVAPHFVHPDDCDQRWGADFCRCPAELVVHDECCTDCHPDLQPNETQASRRGEPFLPLFDELVRVPKLYATELIAMQDKVVHLHFVSPGGEWWIVERDRESNLAFGYACLNDPQNAEWGYVDLTELEALSMTITLSTPTGIPWPMSAVVKRDREWVARPVSQCNLPGWS